MLKKCVVETGWGADRCDRPIWDMDDIGRCYFHSQKEKDPKEFQERFLEEFEKLDVGDSKERVMITRFVFPHFKAPEGLELAISNETIDFGKSTFTGPTDFKAVRFEGDIVDFSEAVFEERVDFSGSEFDCMAHFGDVIFQDEVNFENCDFRYVSFWKTKFLKRARFGNTLVRGTADFEEAEFQGEADFRQAKILRWSDFTKARFRSQVDFANADIRKALFLYTEFLDRVEFGNCKFRKMALFPSCHFKGDSNLGEAKLLGEIDLREARFDRPDSTVHEFISRRDAELKSKLDRGTEKTLDDLLEMAMNLARHVDIVDGEVPVDLGRYTESCRRVFARGGEEASATFLKTLDEEEMLEKIPFRWWACYGAVKAYVDVFGECPQLLVALSKNCMERIPPDEMEAKYFMNRALTVDPQNYRVMLEVLLDRNPGVWIEEMYRKAGVVPPRWSWREEVGILDGILGIRPNDELAQFMRSRIVQEKKTVDELGADFWNVEIQQRYSFHLPLKQVLSECAKWKGRHLDD
jgi:uncharacterized protein YjbI with pentapeptide repeats